MDLTPRGEVAPADTPAPGGLLADRSPAPPPKRSFGLSLALWILAIAGVVGMAFLLYACSIHTIPGDSDGATVVLEAQAYKHGNFLLHDWGLSLDSFWSVDAAIYFVLVVFAGVRPGLLYAGPAIIATGVIVAGVLIAREGRRGAAAFAGAVTVVAVLGLPTHVLAYFFLRGPLHIGTALFALIAFAALRSGRFGWAWAVGVVFLTAGMLGDFQMAAYGVVPVALAGLVAMLRMRDWKAGIGQVSAAAAAFVLQEIGRKVRSAIGGFSIGPTNPIASHHQLATNVKHVVTYGSEFFGIRTSLFPDPGIPKWLQQFHGVAAAALAVAFIVALALLVRGVILGRRVSAAAASLSPPPAEAPKPRRRLHAKPVVAPELWRLDDMLCIATLAPAATFCLLAITVDPQYTRYLTASVVFAAILAGRMVARGWDQLGSRAIRRAVAAVGIACVGLFATSVGYLIHTPGPGQPAGQLVAWMEKHGLHDGVADYWTSNLASVQSRGDVTLRPVVGTTGHILRYPKQSSSQWYAGVKFDCFVINTHLPFGNDTEQTAINTWGSPSSVTKVGAYVVMQWSHPFELNPNPPGS
jgi:hypothetical protein